MSWKILWPLSFISAPAWLIFIFYDSDFLVLSCPAQEFSGKYLVVTQSIMCPIKIDFVIDILGSQFLTRAPKTTYNHQEIIINNSIFCHQSPASDVPEPPNIRQLLTYMLDILTPLTLPASGLQNAALTSKAKTTPTFLTIPLEIRLLIYSYVLHSHPVHHAHLSNITATSTLPPYATEELYQFVIISYYNSPLSREAIPKPGIYHRSLERPIYTHTLSQTVREIWIHKTATRASIVSNSLT